MAESKVFFFRGLFAYICHIYHFQPSNKCKLQINNLLRQAIDVTRILFETIHIYQLSSMFFITFGHILYKGIWYINIRWGVVQQFNRKTHEEQLQKSIMTPLVFLVCGCFHTDSKFNTVFPWLIKFGAKNSHLKPLKPNIVNDISICMKWLTHSHGIRISATFFEWYGVSNNCICL